MFIIRTFCPDCFTVHWIELHPNQRTTCHGPDLAPTNTETHYIRHAGGGMFEIKPKTTTPPPQPTFDDWLLAHYE